jgi:hypothetical protein
MGNEQEFLQSYFGMLSEMMGPLILISLLGFVTNGCLAFCVYFDAKLRNSNNVILWAVLTGFFGWLLGLIYIIVQLASKPKPTYCMRCGYMVPVGFPACPTCGTPSMAGTTMLMPEQVAKYKKLRLVFLIIWIVSTIALWIFYAVIMSQFFENMSSFMANYSYS